MAVTRKGNTGRSDSGIREKFGVDYLIPEPVVRPSEAAPQDPAIERALTAYGRRILQTMRDAPEKTVRVFDLVDMIGLDVNTLQFVVRRMADTELVRVDEADKYGNHKLAITPIGEKML